MNKSGDQIGLRKLVSILLCFLFLMSVFSFSRISSSHAQANVINVPSTEYPTIQDGIDASLPGTIIMIANGTYYEHLTIVRSVSLVGQSRDGTIIDGGDASIVISITASNVEIDNLTVTKSVSQTFDSGISVDRVRGVVVNNSKISSTYTGLSFYSASNNIVSNSVIYNNTSGVVLLYSNNNVFSSNLFSENQQGILVTYSSLNIVAGNTFSNNSEGMVLASTSNRNYFFHNNFEDDVQVSTGTYNTWSRDNEGNYWTNYNGTGHDTNKDGIGDELYRMDDFNIDYFPLMGVYTEHYVFSGRDSYRIATISNSSISGMKFGIGTETGNKILSFNVLGVAGTDSFCRLMIPTALMGPPFVVTGDTSSIAVSMLPASNATNSFLYFSYPGEETSLSVVYSKELELYEKLLDDYTKLQTDMANLNSTYQSLLVNYSTDYQTLLSRFNILFDNFTSLQNSLLSLDASLKQSLQNQSEGSQNFRSLTYVFAALTAAFLITTVYLSSRLYTSRKSGKYPSEDESFANPST